MMLRCLLIVAVSVDVNVVVNVGIVNVIVNVVTTVVNVGMLEFVVGVILLEGINIVGRIINVRRIINVVNVGRIINVRGIINVGRIIIVGVNIVGVVTTNVIWWVTLSIMSPAPFFITFFALANISSLGLIHTGGFMSDKKVVEATKLFVMNPQSLL
ncbi:unnamed protein product [Rhizophagus irregularis]|nr:unnamed protein product [Rhizophagus irregularis]